jgi:putative hemolysin
MLQTQEQARQPGRRRSPLTVTLARSAREVEDAQRLRYRVFAEEMGAQVAGAERGIDSDLFDRHCDHLLVRDGDTHEVVGTYRVLTGDRASRCGGFYSEEEFDLTRLNRLRPVIAEIGRSCVHPDYRGGAALVLLWAEIARYLDAHGCSYLMGCASVGLGDGGHSAASIYNKLQQTSLSPVEYRVFPRCELPLDALDATLDAAVPPLIRGYLRVGAWVCGAPAWDPDFNTADLLMLMPLARVDARYARHFLKTGH